MISKKSIVVLFFWVVSSGSSYAFDQRCDYVITANLDAEHRVLSGNAAITYVNNSPDTLRELYFELYPNAFREGTRWWQDVLDESSLSAVWPKGVNPSRLEVEEILSDGIPLVTEPAVHDTFLKAELPSGLAPGGRIELELTFRYVIPEIFERGGYYEGNYHLIRWYPIVAVYDGSGWNLNEHRDTRSEFYSDFGSFGVTLTVPEDFVVAASGVSTSKASNPDGSTTETFVLENAHNFAFCADRRYRVLSGRFGPTAVNVYYFFPNGNERAMLDAAVNALEFYSGRYGPYAYPELDVVTVAPMFGAMEYPGLVMMPWSIAEKFPFVLDRPLLEVPTVHEVGHSWWYAAVGNNEYEEAWLDEGLNSFSEMQYTESRYGTAGNFVGYPQFLSWLPLPDITRRAQIEDSVIARYRRGYRVPVSTPADRMPDIETFVDSVYATSALLLDLLREEVGRDEFDGFLKEYYARYRGRHANADDFFDLLSERTGKDWSWFRALHFDGTATDPERFRGLNGTYRSGIRYSLVPDFPESDEIVVSALPFPYPALSFSPDFSFRMGIGGWLFAKHRYSAGFSANVVPHYVFGGTERPFGVDYNLSIPLFWVGKPVNSQSLDIRGTHERVSAGLTTRFGPGFNRAYPSVGLNLEYGYEFAGSEGDRHFIRSAADTFLRFSSVKVNALLVSSWHPYAEQSGTVGFEIPVFGTASFFANYSAGWADRDRGSPGFSQTGITFLSNGLGEYQSAAAGFSFPVTGDLYARILREFIVFRGIGLDAGTEGLIPRLPHRMVAGEFPAGAELGVFVRLPVRFASFAETFRLVLAPAACWRYGRTGAETFDCGINISVTLINGLYANGKTFWASSLASKT